MAIACKENSRIDCFATTRQTYGGRTKIGRYCTSTNCTPIKSGKEKTGTCTVCCSLKCIGIGKFLVLPRKRNKPLYDNQWWQTNRWSRRAWCRAKRFNFKGPPEGSKSFQIQLSAQQPTPRVHAAQPHLLTITVPQGVWSRFKDASL